MHEGAASARLGLDGSPGLAEDVIVARDLLIAADTGKAVAHRARLDRDVARSDALGARRGVRVTCEVTPHHLLFLDDRFDDYRADAKVNPPLRGAHDRDALRAAVRDGTIDVFATDHAPHGLDEKAQLLSRRAGRLHRARDRARRVRARAARPAARALRRAARR